MRDTADPGRRRLHDRGPRCGTETTAKVVGERRLATLRDIGDPFTGTGTAGSLCGMRPRFCTAIRWNSYSLRFNCLTKRERAHVASPNACRRSIAFLKNHPVHRRRRQRAGLGR